MVYFFMFAISSVLFEFGIKTNPTKKIMILLSVLSLALLAGFRDFSIGTDVQIYGIYVFEDIKNYHSILELIFNNEMSIELGYAIIAYISWHISHNPHFFFFMVGLINYSLIALAICKYKDDISPTMSWIIFLCLYFSDTFNIMRQTLSLSVFLLGFNYLTNKDYIKVILCSFFAVLFHTTAIIGIIIYFIYYILNKPTFNPSKTAIIIICIAFGATIILPYILPVLINGGLLPEIYKRYLGEGTLRLSVNSVLIRLIPLFIIFIFRNNLKQQNDYYFLLLMLILDTLICNLATLNNTFERISLWFGYFRIFAYSKLVTSKVINRKKNRIILITFFLVYSIIIFYYQVILKGGNQIYPYTSEILGI